MSHALLAGLSRTANPRGALRRFLAADAVVTGINGAAYSAVPGALGRLLGIDSTLLAVLGALLLAVAAGIGFLAARPEPPAAAVELVVGVNAAWALLGIAAVVLWLEPTAAGAVWTPLQALVVACFAALQWSALCGAGRLTA
ncbi:hypothetical protein [Streptomyces sp. I6]|uniref:hypothetical protein n=1 Tax=Streptomyces sp. I6 TaxID=2483113 RepID=UPI000F458A9D|nr:hypothetical protein [Streptomyces sp. I6]RNL73455.1 hypothetical protein EBF04_25955 [Streptomyces sp. I6]